MKFCDFFGFVLLASSFAHPQTSHPSPRSSGWAGDLAMACRIGTRVATTSLRGGSLAIDSQTFGVMSSCLVFQHGLKVRCDQYKVAILTGGEEVEDGGEEALELG